MARTGRPRGFDRDEALLSAMHLFWEHGYEATSLAMLKEAMGGISAASFYAAFASKEALFMEAVDRYMATHGRATAPLRDPSPPPRAAVERALRQSARMQTGDGHPLGCLMVLGASNCSPENRHVQEKLAAARGQDRAAIRACVDRAVEAGELPAGTDAAGLAIALDAVLVGIAILARDGVPFPALDAAVSRAMAAWDDLAGGKGKTRTRRRRAAKGPAAPHAA